jgi:hypothetical protein
MRGPRSAGRLASSDRRARGFGAGRRPELAAPPRLGRLALLLVLARALPAALRPFVVAAMFELLHFDGGPAAPAECKRALKRG